MEEVQAVPRFFVDAVTEDVLILTGENAAHAKVLRLKPGEEVTACDGNGMDYICTVAELSSDSVALNVHSKEPSKTEPKVFASIYMAYAKGDKLEHVIQKATELGASEIVAFPGSRCVAKFDEKGLQKKLPRWQKIAASAAEQSGRGRIPEVIALNSYKEALKRAAQADRAIFFYENEENYTLSAALTAPYKTISLMSGPEGGFSVEEAQQAKEYGLSICTLGTRILRCETAPLCALSAVMFASGEY